MAGLKIGWARGTQRQDAARQLLSGSSICKLGLVSAATAPRPD